MNRTLSVIKLHQRDRFSWIFIPLIILGSSFIVNWLTSMMISEDSMYTGGIASLLVYIFGLGIIVVAQTFPFAISFSISRINYFTGTIVMALLVSFGSALLLLLMSIIENQLTNHWWSGLYFFHLPYLNDGNLLVQLLTLFLFTVHLFLWGFVFGSFYRKFKKSGMLILFLASGLGLTLGSYIITQNQWWLDIWKWITQHTAFGLSLWLIPFILLNALLSFLMLRRSTI
ncbi:hypothetical protein SAMN04487969_13612 [Paenibacillus algorifonticola]|uniref:Uncharacterized protein n=1 Tax=Paenibacillus algorifonticola TaxID=684063 RepID=A0A1I2III8_9BACL|nr:hypothetical protein [Paenibacillus algorifonticola]SFF41473.1 hypothetical protein SAMN04487969_13612 [Paenibacillus algorifonticola]